MTENMGAKREFDENGFSDWLDAEERKLNEKAARKRTGLLKTDLDRLSEIDLARKFIEMKAAWEKLRDEYAGNMRGL